MILLQREIDAGGERTEHRAVRVAALMRGIPVKTIDRVRPGDLSPGVLPVGTVRFVLDALTVNGWSLPPPVDYPDVLRAHLPLVVEFFDEPAVVENALEMIEALMPPGHIVSWPARCNCGSSPAPPHPERLRSANASFRGKPLHA